MTLITVAAGSVEVDLAGREDQERILIGIYNRQTFIPSTGETVLANRFRSADRYDLVEAVYNAVTETIDYAEFTLDSTEDAISDPKLTSYGLLLFADGTDTYLGVLHKNIRVPETPDPTTLADLIAFSASWSPIPQAGSLPVKRLSRDYSSSVTNMAAETDPVEVWIDTDADVAADTTVPSNVTMRFVNRKKLTVAAGVTLTVNGPFSCPDVQIFAGDGDVVFAKGAISAYRTAWWTGPTAGVSIDTALAKARVQALAVKGTEIVIPNGVWLTAGNFIMPSYTRMRGEGGTGSQVPSASTANEDVGTVLKMTAATTPMVRLDGEDGFLGGVHNILFKDLMLDGDELADVTGLQFKNTGAPPPAAVQINDIRFENVKVLSCKYGVDIDRFGIETQASNIAFDSKCDLQNCTGAAMRINCANTIIDYAGNIVLWPSATSYGVEASGEGIGVLKFRNTFFAGQGGVPGTKQVIKQTVVAPAGITADGVAKCVVTKAGMAGSPLTVQFDVQVANHTTAILIAKAAAQALAKDPTVQGNFNVGLVDENIYLQCLDEAADDATFNLTIENVTSVGIVDDVTSTTETAGAARSDMPTAVYLPTAARQLIFEGAWFEYLNNVLDITSPWADLTRVHFTDSYLGAPVRLRANSKGHFQFDSCMIHPKGIRHEDTAYVTVEISGDPYPFNLDTIEYEDVFTNQSWSNFGMDLNVRERPLWDSPVQQFNSRTKFIRNETQYNRSTDPWVQILADSFADPEQRLLRLATVNAQGQVAGYDLYRDATTGWLHIDGTQGAPFNGIITNGDMTVGAALNVTNNANVDGGINVQDFGYFANGALDVVHGVDAATLMRLGKSDGSGAFQFGYTVYRDGLGWLNFDGNQGDPYRGIKTNGGLEAGSGMLYSEADRRLNVYDKTASPHYPGSTVLLSVGSGNTIPATPDVEVVGIQNKNYWDFGAFTAGTSLAFGIINEVSVYDTQVTGGNIFQEGIYNHLSNKFSTNAGGTVSMYGMYNHVEYSMPITQAVGIYSYVASDSSGPGTVPDIKAVQGLAGIGHYASYTRAVAVEGYISASAGDVTTTDYAIMLRGRINAGTADVTVGSLRGLSLDSWSNPLLSPTTEAIGIYMDDTIKQNAATHWAIKSESTSPSRFSGPVELKEVSSSPTAVVDAGVIYSEDDGLGATVIKAKFNSGEVQEIARETSGTQVIKLNNFLIQGATQVGDRVVLSSGDTDVYTVPAGKKFIFGSITHTNPTAGAITGAWKHKRSGVEYRINFASFNTPSNAGTSMPTMSCFRRVLDAGDIVMAKGLSASGLVAWVWGVLIPDTARVTPKTVLHVPGSASVETAYTVPAGKVAYFMETNGYDTSTSAAIFANDTGAGALTLDIYLVPNGEVLSTTVHKLANTKSPVDGGNAENFSIGPVQMNAGDTIQVQSSTSAAGQTIAFTLIEVDA